MPKDNIITVSGKKYEVNLSLLEDFFDNTEESLHVHSAKDLCIKLEDAKDLMIATASTEATVASIKESYQLLTELKLLFSFGLLVEVR